MVLPGAMPGFLLGMRFAVTSALLALVVVEQVNATSGIGHMITLASNYGQTDVIVVGLVVYAVLGLLADSAVRLIERKALAWRRTLEAEPLDRGRIRRSAVRVRDLHRSFNEAGGVLNGLDLDIPPGEFVALLGRSGSGKSTLLRALAGLDRDVAGSGSIAVPDDVSVVFQDSRLLPWRRVLDNVVLGLPRPRRRPTPRPAGAGRGRPRRPRAGLAARAVRRRAAARRAGPVAGARAAAAAGRRAVRRPGRADPDQDARPAPQAVRAHRPAVLLVTHDVDEAIVLADRVIVLDDGVVPLRRARRAAGNRSQADPAFAALRTLAAGRARRGRRRGRVERLHREEGS